MSEPLAVDSSHSHDNLYQTFARRNLSFVRGEGAWLESSSGDKFLDFAAGIAVNSLGHSHPHLVETLKTQAERLWHVSNLYEIPEQSELANRLCAHSFAERVFFTNSGAEAVECALKTARRYHHDRGEPDRNVFLTFEGAFHGRTLATIAAGGQAKYLEGFGPNADGFRQLEYPDLEALKQAIKAPDIAAVLMEPIQGEGGIRSFDASFLRQVRALCDEYGCLLIFDEVQTGIGRTGTLFAHQMPDVAPDIMAIAKGLGSGFPVGACLATEAAAAAMQPGTHGSTFGGNPLAMSVGNAVLDVMLEDGFLDEVRAKGLRLKQKLAALVDSHPDVFAEVRGDGLLLGLKCVKPAGEVVQAATTHNLLLVPAGDNVVRILPPLTVTTDEMDTAIDRLAAAASDLPA